MHASIQPPSPTTPLQMILMLPPARRAISEIIHECPRLRLLPRSKPISNASFGLGIPFLNAPKLRRSALPRVLGTEDVGELLVQVDVDLFLFVPPAGALTGSHEECEMTSCDLSCFVLGEFFAFVGDGVTEDIFVDELLHMLAWILYYSSRKRALKYVSWSPRSSTGLPGPRHRAQLLENVVNQLG